VITFCEVNLCDLPEETLAELQIDLDPSWLLEFASRSWPGSGLAFAGFRGALPAQPVKLGSLCWPQGASRFAVGHYAATESQLADVRAYLDGPGVGVGGLIIDDGQNSITAASMAMLPARPLYRAITASEQTPSPSGLYLLTLVDQRYFFWFAYAQGLSGDSWATLYSDVASALDVEIAVDEISAAYGDPPAGLTAPSTSLPLLLDSIAWLCGQRIVVQFDGSVQAINASTGVSRFLANLAGADAPPNRIAGDVFDMAGGSRVDLSRALPKSVTVVFGQGTPSESATVVNLADVTLPALSGVRGFDATKVLASCQATEDDALAAQWASDWYAWQAYGIDCLFSGALAWNMDGVAELIEVQHGPGPIGVRVQRGPWLDHPPEIAGAAASGTTSYVRILSTGSGDGGNPGMLQQETLSGTTVGYTDVGSSTTVSANIPSGTQTVTPASMAGISVGTVLMIVDSLGNVETVTVTAVSPTINPTSFTATFTNSYAAYPVTGVLVGASGGYTVGAPPTATISGGSGTGATAGAVTLTPNYGIGPQNMLSVASVAISAGGSGYNPTPPTISFSGGTGTALATVQVGGAIQVYIGAVWVQFNGEYSDPNVLNFPVAGDVTTPVYFQAELIGNDTAGTDIYLAQVVATGRGTDGQIPIWDQTGGNLTDSGVYSGDGTLQLTGGKITLNDPDNGPAFNFLETDATGFSPLTGGDADAGQTIGVAPPDWTGNPNSANVGASLLNLYHFPTNISAGAPSHTVLLAQDGQGTGTGKPSTAMQVVVAPPGYNSIAYAGVSYTEDPASVDLSGIVTRIQFGVQVAAPYVLGVVLNIGAALSPGPGTGSNVEVDGQIGQTGTGGAGDTFTGGVCTALAAPPDAVGGFNY